MVLRSSLYFFKGERMNFLRIFSVNSGNRTHDANKAEVKEAITYAVETIIVSASSRFPEYRSPIEVDRIIREAQRMLRG